MSTYEYYKTIYTQANVRICDILKVVPSMNMIFSIHVLIRQNVTVQRGDLSYGVVWWQ